MGGGGGGGRSLAWLDEPWKDMEPEPDLGQGNDISVNWDVMELDPKLVLKQDIPDQRCKLCLMLKQLQILSWNVCGLSKPTKARAVKNWITHKGGKVDVFAIQEIKTWSWSIQHWLKKSVRKGQVVFDKPVGSKGGTALVLRGKLQVLEQGVGGDGRMHGQK
ncbi:hypothetical protein R1sor_018526 [Riccia sorocarpa]|uniref:Endonuclease/exonuclease/phosphatase domain-containing protein n=1 Tax=Riccia sorocarpa TaxID=122646 RepID=A0ABD3IG59_9MARC